jgi:biotin--protein ligase
VSPLSLSHTILTLSLLLLPHYTVQPVTPQTLGTQPWEPNCALLVIPGGRDLPYVEELSVKTRVTKRIGEYVREGGRYLGICAGAYFGAKEVVFDQGGDMEVRGDRELVSWSPCSKALAETAQAFFPGTCVGPTHPGFAYAAESGSRAVSLLLENVSSSRQTLEYLYYNGGGHFILPPSLSGVEVLARYADRPVRPGATENAIAAVRTSNGKGKALLCSVHFEYPLHDPPAKDAIAKLDIRPEQDEVDRSEKARIAWVEELLEKLGLEPPGRKKDKDEGLAAIVHGAGEEDPSLLLHPTHPSPIFVFPIPLLPEIGTSSFASPSLKNKMTEGEGGWKMLRDGNDVLLIGEIDAMAEDVPPSAEAVTRALAKRRRAPPKHEALPPVETLSLEDTTPPPPQLPDFHSVPKTVLLPSSSQPYTPSWTPLFNFETYWAELTAARKRSGKKSGVLRRSSGDEGEHPALGDLVWYAETVTSTQTMLDQ